MIKNKKTKQHKKSLETVSRAHVKNEMLLSTSKKLLTFFIHFFLVTFHTILKMPVPPEPETKEPENEFANTSDLASMLEDQNFQQNFTDEQVHLLFFKKKIKNKRAKI